VPLSAAQIVLRACQIANVPGMVVQAGQYLNDILTELNQEYDLNIALHTAIVTINGATATGPYPLPPDYLRASSRDITYTINGVPYILTQISLAQFDSLINTVADAGYPYNYATDVSTKPASLFVYPPPVLTIPVQFRYWGNLPDIPTPETSPIVPWFPSQNYLKVRLAGELMRDAGDPRANIYLGDGPSGAVGILRRWLNLQGDKEDIIEHVQLDARFFGASRAYYPPSKATGGI
jgi:hypothetical protein